MALLCSTASAATENKNLPAAINVINYANSITATNSSADVLFNSIISENPTWKTDMWQGNSGSKVVSVYYRDIFSVKGYGSYYIENGKYITPSCTEKYKLVGHYVGL